MPCSTLGYWAFGHVHISWKDQSWQRGFGESFCWNRSVADDIPAGFRQGKHNKNEAAAGQDGEKPKDPSPAKMGVNCSAEYWPKTRSCICTTDRQLANVREPETRNAAISAHERKETNPNATIPTKVPRSAGVLTSPVTPYAIANDPLKLTKSLREWSNLPEIPAL